MSPFAQLDAEYSKIVDDCATQGRALARQLASAGLMEPLYLYCKPGTEKESGRLFLVRDSAPNPYGYALVTGEGLRANVPYSKFYDWIYQRARRAPVLCIGGSK